MNIVYSDDYKADLGDHIFPTDKYRLAREILVIKGEFGIEHFEEAPLASKEDILRFHTAAYFEKLEKNTLTHDDLDYIELPFNESVFKWAVTTAGGTLKAARIALKEKICCHLGGGFHHAYSDHGEALCVINDVGVAVATMLAKGEIGKALVLDLDVHQGNGTLAHFRDDPRVLCFSMHETDIYPLPKEDGGINIELKRETGDDEYLAALESALPELFTRFSHDIVFYLAGADPYKDDQVGRLNMTMKGLEQRDDMVFRAAADRDIPIVSVAAGGYARRVEDVVNIHANTVRVAGALLDEKRYGVKIR